MINAIMISLANILSSYGLWSAGIPSGHGMYEEKVPQNLINMKKI